MKMNIKNIIHQHFYGKYLLLLLLAGLISLILPQTAHAMEPIYAVLQNTTSGEGMTVKNVWTSLINIANTFVVVILIAVAFAQILRINVSTYGVKKILPTLVFAIIAANFSFLFCRLMIDVANALLSIFFEGVGTATKYTLDPQTGVNGFATAFDVKFGDPKDIKGGQIFWFIIAQLFKIAAAVGVYILAFLFLVRNWMIYFLVALSPLCIMAMVLPQTKSLFTQWWSNFVKWVFMPIVSVFWIWLGAQWLDKGFGSGAELLNYIFGGICIYLAITTPFKMGGAIMGQWGGIGKKVWGATGGAIGKGIKGGASQWYGTQKQHAIRRAEDTRLGRVYTGYRDRTKLKRDIADEMLNNQRGTSYRATALRSLNSRTAAQWDNERLRAEHSRLQKIVGNGVNEESNNPAYKDSLAVADLQGRVIMNTAGDVASAYDFSNPDNLVLSPAQQARYNRDGGLSLFEGSAASVKEILRRARITGLKDNSEAIAARGALGLRTNMDTRVLASSGVGEVVEGAGATIRRTLPAQASQIIASASKNINFDEATKDLGVSEEVKVGLKKSYEEIQKSCQNAYEELLGEGQKAIEDEVEGVKIILESGSKHGYQRNQLAAELAKAQEMYKNQDIDGLLKLTPSIISDPAGVSDSKSEKLKAIKTRMDHLEAGLQHFDKIASIENASERTAAIAHANSIIQKDPSQYVSEVSKNLSQQNELQARAQVSSGVAVESMASNPALQGVNVGSMGSNEKALGAIAESLEGLKDQIHTSSSGPGLDPHTITPGGMADKAEFMNMAKEAMKGTQQQVFAGGGSAQGTLSDRQTRRLFAEELGKATAKSLSKTLSQTPLKVQVTNHPTATPTPPAAQPPAAPTAEPPAPQAPTPPAPPEKPEE